MKYLYWFITDTILDLIEGLNRLGNVFRKKPKHSLITSNVLWCTESEWMDRLVSYKQLELWTKDK
jgi:hypothetical protein